MKLTPIFAAAALASVAIAGCDRPGTHTAANTPVSGSTTSTTVTTTTAPATPAAPASTAADTSAPARDTTAAAAAPVTGSESANVVTDTLVTGKVKTAITADNAMKDADISVKTENGVVTLTGTVKSPDQVTLASALAQRQEGVNRVENQVAVR
jgi:hyperosmotically inducible protein